MNTVVKEIQLDHQLILDLIKTQSTVLDLGCGSGDLLYLLAKEKKARVQGIEIDDQAIYKCVAKGLNVFHGDIDSGLAEFSDKSFDYVVLNQSMQQILHVDKVLTDALRVGKKVVVGLPNFAYYRSRFQMFFQGKAPVTVGLPYQWYETLNLHFLSIKDFKNYCSLKNINIEYSVGIGENKKVTFLPNLFAHSGIFLISK
ncbi:MAG: methionine biosynthesis protein MetW [Candidatus Omnitrophica bacterium CG11_big_fil_rev_8_21_14_0_20_41_12]|nr:MAG: methionine biosynthesis protein MetW [Candidatus Omnitrophica bacterium CG11_big_fil_rev_8_21_14_0_20_41_12]